MMYSIEFGSKQIDFTLEYSDRKSLGITVTPDLFVMVKAPADTSLEEVKKKLKRKAPWIIKQQSFFLTFHPKTPARKFVSGETHLYLGRQYRLKIIIDDDESVKLKGRFIEVRSTNKSKVKQSVKKWYLQNAKTKLHGIAEELVSNFKKYKVEPASIVLRDMTRRWGSCTPKGKLILNTELIKAPK